MSVRKLRKPLLISRPFLGAIDGFTIGLILGLWTDFLWLAKKIVIFDESMSYPNLSPTQDTNQTQMIKSDLTQKICRTLKQTDRQTNSHF